MKCDVCGYKDKSSNGSVVLKCNDNVRRCKLCRQRAVYGQTFWNDDDEYDAYKRGEGNHRFDVIGRES